MTLPIRTLPSPRRCAARLASRAPSDPVIADPRAGGGDRVRPYARLGALAVALLLAGTVLAQTARLPVDQAAAPLGEALASMARTAGVQVVFSSSLTEGRRAPALKGSYTPQEALERLLAGSGLLLKAQDASTYTVESPPPPTAGAAGAATLPEVRAVASSEPVPGTPPRPYAGGQVARGAQIGVLGDRGIFDTPVAIKAFTEAYISDQIAFVSNDLMARDASFTITNAATINGATAGRLRGFRMEPFESSFDGFATVSSRRYPLEMLERVEVLKGPTTIFTGIVGGVGGTINYVSKKPLEEPLTRVTALYASQGQVGTQLDLSRRFGEDQAFGVRLNVAVRDGETAIDDLDEANRVAHLALNWRSERVNADVQFGSLFSETRGSAGGYFLPAGVAVPRVPDASQVGGPDWDRRTQRDQFVRAAVDVSLSEGWSAFVVLGLSSNYERFVGMNANVTGPGGAGTLSTFAQEGRSDWGDNRSADLGLRGRFSTGAITHRVTVAAGHRQQESDYSNLRLDPDYVPPVIDIDNPSSYDGPAPGLLGNDFFPLSDTRTDGVTLVDELSLLDDRLLVTAGVRYTRFDVKSFNYGAPTPPGEGSRYRSGDWSPSFGVLYKLSPAWSVYANRLNAVEQGAVAPVEASNRGEVIAPGVARQVEAGTKVDLGRYAVTASVFDIERPSTYTNDEGVFGLYGKNRHRGVELDLFGEPTRGLRTQLSYTHLEAKVRANADPTVIGNRPVSVPANVLVLGVDADVPGWPGAAVLANVRHVGRQAYDLSNDRWIGSHTVADVGARLRFDAGGTPVTARLAVSNLLDRDYFQSTDFTLQTGAPRTVRLSVQADF